MALTFKDIQDEVKFRGTRSQSGTQFDTTVKNIINASLFRISRTANWKALRRDTTFDTEAQQTSGSVNATKDLSVFTGTSLNLITNNIQTGRRINIGSSTIPFTIETITDENAFTTNIAYDLSTDTGLTYKIFGREEYNLPIQTGKLAVLWHEKFGYPYVLNYLPTLGFLQTGTTISTGDTPTHYREWGEDDVTEQPLEASIITISSSSSADTSKKITIFGTVSSFPDFETITTHSSDGTTAVNGSKSFTNIDRVTKDATTTGRITCTANSANTTVATLPVGDTTGRVQLKKVQLYPIPTEIFPINVFHYKDPWRLVADEDVHELGGDFDEAIILLSVAKIKFESAQKEGKEWMVLYKEEIASLRKINADKLDFFTKLERPHRNWGRGNKIHSTLSFDQLGGQYGPSYR